MFSHIQARRDGCLLGSDISTPHNTPPTPHLWDYTHIGAGAIELAGARAPSQISDSGGTVGHNRIYGAPLKN